MSWTSRHDLRSWGLPAQGEHQFQALCDRTSSLPRAPAGLSMLAHGNGRSYGDVGLNTGQALLGTRGLDRFIAFDRTTGVLSCEAGVLLSEVLALVVPHGWFVAVVPGTRFITVGGAIANDIHGKNHHAAGSFGRHVVSFELLRSDGQRLQCSPVSHPEFFAATIGGLGLTGLITRATLQLQRVPSIWMKVQSHRFENLQAFADLNQEAEAEHDHVVAWLDTSGSHTGRGILMQASPATPEVEGPFATPADVPAEPWLAMPFAPPVSLVSRSIVKVFNAAYLRRVPRGGSCQRVHAYPFLFPLDGVLHWNRVYGRRGFYQYQCVVPLADAHDVMAELLGRIARSGECSFLTVLKRLGALPSPGLLSFARQGWTLALDFPDAGASTLGLFDELDTVVAAAGGRLYPAKDARMSAAMFRQGYPAWEQFSRWVDPAFSSSFWRRVTAS